MYIESLRPDEEQPWELEPWMVDTFVGGKYQFQRLFGRCELVRLLGATGVSPEGWATRPNRLDGEFWFAKGEFDALVQQAKKDLAQQGVSQRVLGAYLRLELRERLAVCRDWTPNFDRLACLIVPSQKFLVAAVGDIKEQPVYDKRASAPGCVLEGGRRQLVINFECDVNHEARAWIQPYSYNIG